jgi:hypothetical protein
LVPGQYSSGGKTRLGSITKAGDRYLRTLLVLGARAVLAAARTKVDRLSRWALALEERRGYWKAVVAIADGVLALADVHKPMASPAGESSAVQVELRSAPVTARTLKPSSRAAEVAGSSYDADALADAVLPRPVHEVHAEGAALWTYAVAD